jgi:membrane associated rhomboid family serine protease
MDYRNYGRPSIRFGPPLTDWVKILIIVNVAVFIVQMIGVRGFDTLFGLIPSEVFGRLKIWQFVTYMFLHGGFWHIFFNMFMLWMFGSELERDWGPDTFIRFYVFTGIGAGLVSWITAPGSQTPIIGASGAIFGILLAYALAYPNRQVLIYFLFPVKVKYLVIGLCALNFFAAMGSAETGIAHFAHLGGLLFGYIYLRWFMRSGRAGTASFAGWAPSGWSASWRRWQAKRHMKVVDLNARRDAESRLEVDRILEKITRVGVEGLTPEERKLLQDESDRTGMDA